jgi:hypothetical protein
LLALAIIIIRKITMSAAAAGTPLTGKHVNVAMMTSGGKQTMNGLLVAGFFRNKQPNKQTTREIPLFLASWTPNQNAPNPIHTTHLSQLLLS